ncbi:MAG: Holliday junction resolvase RecU [Lachnospiraceae bacterium]|nr:Holliday junction resolvase RecU [Lachnospiraceae bacterium]
MATWNSRGLRGSVLEEMVNLTNERYREKRLALVQKIPTSIKPVQFDKEHRHITLAYFDQKSTVDYIGAVQGIPVCFDAKECASDSFPLHNIHEHQITFMKDFEQQGGISFLLIYFSKHNKCYYLRFEKMMEFWNRQFECGKKHFKYYEMEDDFEIPIKNATFVHYLETLNQDLLVRKKKS